MANTYWTKRTSERAVMMRIRSKEVLKMAREMGVEVKGMKMKFEAT